MAPPLLPDPPPPGDPIELSWEAPARCPDAEAVRARLDRWAPAPEDARRLRADARVQVDDDGFVLELKIDDGVRTESRRIRSRDCDALARATGLVVAVAIDPLGVAAVVREIQATGPREAPPVAEPAGASVPAPPAEPSVTEPAPVVPGPRDATPQGATLRRATPSSARDRATPRKLPVRFAARSELLVGGGLLPGAIGLGVAGTLAVLGRARPWRAELGGAYWFPRRATVADVPAAGGELWLAHARGSGCGVPALARVEFPICAGVDLGAVGGTGFGEGVDTRTNTDLLVGMHGGVGVAWAPIPALALVARVEAIAALRRPGFEIVGVGDVHRVGAAGARGAVGLEVRFFR